MRANLWYGVFQRTVKGLGFNPVPLQGHIDTSLYASPVEREAEPEFRKLIDTL